MIVRLLLQMAGVLIVLFGLREVFRDIFHPTRSGSLSDWIGRLTSVLLRHTRFRPTVGPLALVSVISCWAVMLVFGFALIYCGSSRIDFGVPDGAAGHDLWHHLFQGLYVSLGAFDTFQTFDVAPHAPWLRLLIAVEGLVGISMITASVSWLVLLYPALARIRRFAKETTLLVRTEQATGLSAVRDIGMPRLDELTRGIVQFRLDVILFPILLNFYAADPAATISSVLPSICRFAEEALATERSSEIRLAGMQLQIALNELARTLAERVVKADPENPAAVFAAYQRRND